ncbi:hypothetical protein ACFL1X_06710 [Candidatus Hydrogenedentota bacterium]
MSTLMKRGKKYYVKYYKDGKQSLKCCEATRKQDAQAMQRAVDEDLFRGEYPSIFHRKDMMCLPKTCTP